MVRCGRVHAYSPPLSEMHYYDIEAGEVPGAVVVERNHLEWRLHPGSDARLPIAGPGQRWIVICSEGYTSSLAAASLVSLGIQACDMVGGVRAWAAAGLPVVAGGTPVEHVVRTA